ncbi:MAG: hypothetical protein KF850_29975 [Labilithrix sp.]|nr:hypothetical protein [Labilithrix sp.]MBX3203199.1 hypothetical protein [Labilithrix sp.]MBX3216306.1 hypothetical protein [Labilithrix sp.]
MGEIVYVLCALTSLACAILLVRSYLANRSPLLLWSSVCFVGLFANNVLLVVDVVLTRDEIDLLLARDLTNLASVTALVFGLVWRAR